MKRKHLETNFLNFYLIEKYKEKIEELENEITAEESNLNDDELIDEVDLKKSLQSKKLNKDQGQDDDENEIDFDEPDEKLIEKIINLISKKQKIRNGNIRRK